MLTDSQFDRFKSAYIAAMLWSSCDDKEEPLDSNYDESDIAPDTMKTIDKDCREFIALVGNLINAENCKRYEFIEQAGHDLWFTCAGHGVGFWDGDWQSDKGNGLEGPLTKAAKQFAHETAYVGDDGKIYLG